MNHEPDLGCRFGSDPASSSTWFLATDPYPRTTVLFSRVVLSGKCILANKNIF